MRALKMVAVVLALLALYLLAWPTGLEPVAWTPPPAPALEGAFAYNDKLRGIQKLAPGLGDGPEAVNVDAVGRVYTGYDDGRIVMLAPNGASYTELGNTQGRPLGITFGPKGGLIIADAKRGLLHLGNGTVTTLATAADGRAFGFTDDADNTRLDKNIYFTDASHKYGYGRHLTDILEHGPNGRLLEYNVLSKQTRVLLSGLHFASGVAVGPDDAYVLVNEAAAYRVLRYWLKGEKAGTHDVFIDNLPGFPDSITFNNRSTFWLALFAPRDEMLDELLPGNLFLRKVIARLPAFLQPRAKRHAFVLGLDLDGKVVHNLQYAGDDAYAPITSVREYGPWLYFGSLTFPAIGRIPLSQVVPGSPPPPAGWDQLPHLREQTLPARQEPERPQIEVEERD